MPISESKRKQSTTSMTEFSLADISSHSSAKDLYLVLYNKVYDVTKFQHEHPGGADFLIDQGGTDVTELFEDAGHSDEARELLEGLQIGVVGGTAKTATSKTPSGNQLSSSGFGLPAILISVVALLVALFLYPKLGLGGE